MGHVPVISWTADVSWVDRLSRLYLAGGLTTGSTGITLRRGNGPSVKENACPLVV